MTDLERFKASNQEIEGLLEQQQAIQSSKRSEKKKVADAYPIPRHQGQEWFVRGPVPGGWLETALSFGGKAGNLALALWWLVGMNPVNPIRLTKQVLEKFCVSAKTSRRVLKKWERAGLVLVDRKQGRGPDVTLLPVKSEISTDERERPQDLARRANTATVDKGETVEKTGR